MISKLSLNKLTKGWVICSLGALFFGYEYLLRVEPSIMVSELMNHFDLTFDKFGALISLYYFAYAPMQLFVGIILDIYKTQYVLTVAVFICALGSLFFCFSDQLFLVAIGRFLIGMGSAFAFVGALKLATIWLPENRFALFSGMVTALGMLGGFLGNVALMKLSNLFGWRGTLYLTTAMGCILLPFMWYRLKEKKSDSLNNLSSRNNCQQLVKRLQIFKNKEIWKIGMIGSMLFLTFPVFAELWGITFLKEVYHLNSNQATLANSLIFLGWLIGAPINGYLSDRFKSKELHLGIGCLLSAMIISLILYIPNFVSPYLQLLLFIFGIVSSSQILCFVLGRAASPPHLFASTVAFINVIVMLVGLLLQLLVGFLLHCGTKYLTLKYAYPLIFSILPAFFLAGGIITCFLKRHKQSDDQNLEHTILLSDHDELKQLVL